MTNAFHLRCRENRLLIVGHSFVCRMELELRSYNWDVGKDYQSVELIGVSGMRVNALASYLRYARQKRSTVVVLDAGTNDLGSAYSQGTTIAAKVYAIACQYADIPSVRHVIVGEVIRRGNGNAKFESERVNFNSELRRLSGPRCDIHTIRHRGLTHIGQCVIRDQVHLNSRGMQHYIMNIRKEVRHWAKR